MFTENKRPINRCQYWSVYEPVLCSFWDKDKTTCTYNKEATLNGVTVSEKADFYPYCNYIGTAKNKCKQYSPTTSGIGQEEKPRCVLPDPYRHLYMSPICSKKWVVPNTTTDGTLEPLDYSKISGYNNGDCDYKSGNISTGGTSVTCSGFSAHHLGFGTSPITEKCELSGKNLDDFLNSKRKLPFNYDILNKRSELGRCYRWVDNDDYLFTLTAPTVGTVGSDGKISGGDTVTEVPLTITPPKFSCNHPSKEAKTFENFYKDEDNNYIRPPCNGAMPDCPKYTGNLVSTGYLPFLSSVYLRDGDKVMAEQILELRYNLQKESWNPKEYEDIFGKYAIIYAHTGQSPEIIYDDAGNIKDYSLASTKVSIKDFTCFAIDRTQVLLTPGTPSDNTKISFDTLIKELKDLFLEPIIRSFFDTVFLTNDKNLSFAQKTQYIFETTKTTHKKILILGDYFYNKNIFAINISDPDISFPFKYLFDLGNMASFRRTDISDRVFKEKHAALVCYLKVLTDTAPEKLYYNESVDNDRCFMISVDTFFGENHIMVFDTSNEIYTFDVITIEKHFCGGIISQTNFKISNLNEFIDTNENYEAYSCLPRYNPEITYEFKPLNTSTGSYTTPYLTYLDTRVTVPPANPLFASDNLTLFLGYSLYKIKALPRFIVSTCDTTTYSRFIFLGNSGKMLVIIDDAFKLHAIIRKWDTGEVDDAGNSKPIVLFLNGVDSEGTEKSIEMEVLEHCSDRLEINQMIIKPKKPEEYVRLYSPVIDFKSGLYIYEKYSFGKTPKDNGYAEDSFVKIRDGYPEDDLTSTPPRVTTIIQDLTELSGDLDSGAYTLKRLPTFPIVASVIFRGALTTRIRGQIKSDLLLWIKQPFCCDVEINYSWTANYKNYIVQPTGNCFVSDIGLTYTNTSKVGYSPGCGDHNFGRISQRPSSMWYPYTACDAYAKYNITAGSGEYDIAPMEFWLNAIGQPIVGKTPYGSHNLRMLGPASHYGMTTDTHASIWACHCDYTHQNTDMISEPWFSGSAKIRSGVEGETLFYMVQNGGIPPKFGNKKRGYLLSFRSTAALYYYKVNDSGSFTREKKWLPAYEAFSDVSLSDSFKEYPWLHYFNLNDNISTYISQLGLGVVINDINGVTVNEELVYTEDFTDPTKRPLKRYAFTDIFKAHYTTTGMLYPEPRKKHYLGLSQKPITAWLTYKDYPDDATKSIQWAWRELWKPLKRDTPDIRQLLRDIDLAVCSAKEYYKLYLSFMDIAYTNYTYNFYISEFRRIPTEGTHKISWLPSIYDKDNPLPTHFIVRMDDGPLRLLNSKCELIKEEKDIDPNLKFTGITSEDIVKHFKFYDACKGASWLNGVTDDMALEEAAIALQNISGATAFILYDSETAIVEDEVSAKAKAKEAKREIEVIDDAEGKITFMYFNRGLICSIKPDMLKYLPKKDVIIDTYEFKLSLPTHDESDFSKIDVDEFYPPTEFNLYYSSDFGYGGGSASLSFKFASKLIVSKVEITYKTGIITEDSTKPEYQKFYNIPGIELNKSDDGITYESLFKSSYEFVENIAEEFVTKTYSLPVDNLDFMSSLIEYFSIDFQYIPDVSEFPEYFEPLVSYSYILHVQSIKVYTIEYIQVDENIEIYERKFNISVGYYGTFPIHGFDSTGNSCLYPNPYELSTTYQYDTAWGMAGMPASEGKFTSIGKTYDRIAFEIRPDGEVLEGTYTDFELRQKDLYDEVALSGDDTMQLYSIFDKVYKETLLNTKVSVLPNWLCTLENKAIVPLKPVKTEKLFYPEGHNWTWDRSSFRDFFNCGGAVRQWRTIFDYRWGRMSGTYGYDYETDIFDLYSYGLSRVLTNWVNGEDGRAI